MFQQGQLMLTSWTLTFSDIFTGGPFQFLLKNFFFFFINFVLQNLLLLTYTPCLSFLESIQFSFWEASIQLSRMHWVLKGEWWGLYLAVGGHQRWASSWLFATISILFMDHTLVRYICLRFEQRVALFTCWLAPWKWNVNLGSAHQPAVSKSMKPFQSSHRLRCGLGNH